MHPVGISPRAVQWRPQSIPALPVETLGPARPLPSVILRPLATTVVGRYASDRWAWTERLHDPHAEMVQRHFLETQKHTRPDVVQAFGSATPASSEVLLHYAGDPPPGVPLKPYPVLLVHGAGASDEYLFDLEKGKIGGGMADQLRQQGFKVFAVTFAHNQDDNYLWVQQIANATARMRTLTGAEKVDVVAHSKGGLAARMLVSDFRQPWMTPFQHDIHRVILAGAPLGGVDYSFRHPAVNQFLGLRPGAINAPMSWDRELLKGTWTDTSAASFSAQGPDYFPGQRQMLAHWDKEYALPTFEQDWYTTYYGGSGAVSHSTGIDQAMADGGNMMARLQATPISSEVQVALLAGDNPNLRNFYNETTGRSDGMVFTNSELEVPPGTHVMASEVLPLNHIALVRSNPGIAWIAKTLAVPD